jgi:flagellar hook-associated protein 3 FlgL
MRITTQMIYNNFNADLHTNMEGIYRDDTQISSGKKLNKPSDNPADMYSIISGEAQLRTFAGYQDAITNATTLLNGTSTALTSVGSLLSTAQQTGESTSSDSTAMDIQMMSTLIQGVISIGNSQLSNRYIFAGYTTDQPAINATTGMYQGTSNRISQEINSGVSIDTNIAGNESLAYGPALATSVNSGLLGAAGGITPSFAFTTAGGTLNISLGGPATTVTIAAGATLSDVTAAINNSGAGVRAEIINANANGTPADYRVMLSAAPASNAAAISVTATTTDAAGTGLNLFASAPMTSVVSPDRTVIGAMSILKTALEIGDKAAITRAVSGLKDVSLTLRQQQADLGVRLNRINLEKNYLATRDTDVTNAVSAKLMLTEVEMAGVITDAQQKQTSLTALRNISSGFLQTSLFDFLK